MKPIKTIWMIKTPGMMQAMTLIYLLQTCKFMPPISSKAPDFPMNNGMHFLMMQSKSGTHSALKQKQLFFDLFQSRNRQNHPILATGNPLQDSSTHCCRVGPSMSMNWTILPHVFMNFMGETHHLRISKISVIHLLNLLMVSPQCMKTVQSLIANLY